MMGLGLVFALGVGTGYYYRGDIDNFFSFESQKKSLENPTIDIRTHYKTKEEQYLFAFGEKGTNFSYTLATPGRVSFSRDKIKTNDLHYIVKTLEKITEKIAEKIEERKNE
jgi:hypothetical protein